MTHPYYFFSILSLEKYWAISTHNEAVHYVVFSTPFYRFALMPKYSPQRPILQQSQPAFFPQCQRNVSHPNTITRKIRVPYVFG